MDTEAFSRRVWQQRKKLGLSQETLAEQASVSRNYISLIERGEAHNVSLKIVNQLAAALAVTPAELMELDEDGEVVVLPALRELALAANLSFAAVERLARLPRPGREPQTVQEWQQIYQAVRIYIE
ncbi:MAG: helix-turn-helix transcriptional regulator [Anaerolineales bacterium]|nr:helix-turn-helix transcriptional regulator [Anaerolineales bacterium]